MISRLHVEKADTLIPRLFAYPEISVRLGALFSAYGTETSFFNIWIQGDYSAVLARLDSTFFMLELSNADFEEAAFFLEFNSNFKRLVGSANTVEKLSKFFSYPFSITNSNLLKNSTATHTLLYEPVKEPELSAVFEVLTGNNPIASVHIPWYTDISHRIRHDCARAYLIYEDTLPTCACLISAESNRAGLISGVVTKPEYRGRGFASAIVTCACLDLLKDGKTPVLECSDNILGFYKRLGFEKIDQISKLTLGQ